MKKVLPIIAVAAAALTIGSSVALARNSRFSLTNAVDPRTSYTLEITSANATGSVEFDNEFYAYRFQLSSQTVRDGKPFNSDANYSYFVDYTLGTDTVYEYGGDHILVVQNSQSYYGNALVYIRFPFSGPAELTTANVFYRINDATEDTEEALTDDGTGFYFEYSIPGNCSITINKFSFKYLC